MKKSNRILTIVGTVMLSIAGTLLLISLVFRLQALPHRKAIEVNGKEYKGYVSTDGVIYSIFDGNDTLTFAGNGCITNREDWVELSKEERLKVKQIVIEEGITYVDNCEFDGQFLHPFPNLEKVVIKAELQSVGANAFSNNPALKEICFEKGCMYFGRNAFKGLSNAEVSGVAPESDAFWYEYEYPLEDAHSKEYNDLF